MSGDHPNILCVGRLYCDVIFTDLPRMPTAGTEVFAGGLGIHAGGGAAITAGHLAALGHQTALAACYPGADFGNIVRRELQDLKINLDLCRDQDPRFDPQLTSAFVQNGERAFVTHRAGPAFPQFTAQDIDHFRPAHIHIGEATTLVDNPNLIEIARTLGATLSLDCSWDDNLDADKITRLLPEIDVFLPNDSEVQLLQKLGVPAQLSKITVIKQGCNGASALFNGSQIHAPAVSTQVVDTTGAGDAFNAAFLGAWLKNKPIEHCLELGNAKGANSTTFRGGLGGLSNNVVSTD